MNRHNRKRMENREGPGKKTKRFAGQAVKNSMGFIEGAGHGAMGLLQRIDDSTQAFARNQLLQLPTDGTMLQEGAFMKGPRNALGTMIFAARPSYGADATAFRGLNDTEDLIGLGLSRALQGGTITAAGAGLVALTGQFGGQADQPEPAQLPLN